MVNQWRNYGADEGLYEICVRGPRLLFGAPTLWNAVSLHFEGRNHCSNPTVVRYVTVFNLRFVKNIKLKHFRGPYQVGDPRQVASMTPPSRRSWLIVMSYYVLEPWVHVVSQCALPARKLPPILVEYACRLFIWSMSETQHIAMKSCQIYVKDKAVSLRLI